MPLSNVSASMSASTNSSKGVPASPNPVDNTDEWFYGHGPSADQIRSGIRISSGHNIHTLIIGETGTGKEFVARELYSKRRKRLAGTETECPFVAVNCGAIPEALAESILFGHERGAFTSARERQFGKFELARNGTLFLDEIQSLSLATQVKLLRVLQSGELEPLGSRKPSRVNCQVVAATNVPLELLVKRNLFRKDLFFRLNVCPIYLPALRDRLVDLPIIIKALKKRIFQNYSIPERDLSPNAYELLMNYNWPGNIRELEHTLMYGSLRAPGAEIRAEDLPGSVTGQLEGYLNHGSWHIA